MDGDQSVLKESGLAERMKAAVLAATEAICRPSSEVSGVVTCTIAAQVRLLVPGGGGYVRRVSESAAGAGSQQALTEAAKRLAEKNI